MVVFGPGRMLKCHAMRSYQKVRVPVNVPVVSLQRATGGLALTRMMTRRPLNGPPGLTRPETRIRAPSFGALPDTSAVLTLESLQVILSVPTSRWTLHR